jgi:hypothetical protein
VNSVATLVIARSSIVADERPKPDTNVLWTAVRPEAQAVNVDDGDGK